jgi:hypothetical protein
MHGLDVVGRPLLAQLTPEAPLLRAAPKAEGRPILARQVRAGFGDI